MTLTNGGSFNDKVNFIWSVADLLRGDLKQSEYGRVILPLVVLRRSLTDALLFEQFKDDWTGDPEIQAAATANDLDNFRIVFAKKFMNVVLQRMDANADIFKAILDDDAFARDLQNSYGRDVYRELRDDVRGTKQSEGPSRAD